MFSFRSLLYMIMLALLIIFFFGCTPPPPTVDPPKPKMTSAQQWEQWINLLHIDMKSVVQSADWIEKHRGEISIPDEIDFMDYNYVKEWPFLVYGIFITTDHNGKLRVGRNSALGYGWPPAQTPLKVGDKLLGSFSFENSFQWTGQNLSDFEAFIKNRTYYFVLEAKKPYNITDATGSTITYKSSEGATIHYNADKIITQIEGTVLKRHHPF